MLVFGILLVAIVFVCFGRYFLPKPLFDAIVLVAVIFTVIAYGDVILKVVDAFLRTL